MLEHAERMHRRFFHAASGQAPCWEPPADVVEDEDHMIVQIALPGVPASAIDVQMHAEGITVAGVRAFPAARSARIHRMEIPYGRFERRVALPMRMLGNAQIQLADGCLCVRFEKTKEIT
jgi:HSP20 family protein